MKKTKILFAILLLNTILYASCDCSPNVTSRYTEAREKIDPKIKEFEEDLKEYNESLDSTYDYKKKDVELADNEIENKLEEIVRIENELHKLGKIKDELIQEFQIKNNISKQEILLLKKSLLNSVQQVNKEQSEIIKKSK